MSLQSPLLICYDGSEGSETALRAAIEMFDHPAVVTCYWQPFAESAQRMRIELLEMVQDPASINEREEALAESIARQGADIVTAGGGTADAAAVKVEGPIDQAILRHADEIDASVIVLGSRSRSGIGSMLLGDTAADVVQLASRPVFVVPSPRLANVRRANRESGDSATV
jgi:nucleotide-binding universal stress UspA family protein